MLAAGLGLRVEIFPGCDSDLTHFRGDETGELYAVEVDVSLRTTESQAAEHN